MKAALTNETFAIVPVVAVFSSHGIPDSLVLFCLIRILDALTYEDTKVRPSDAILEATKNQFRLKQTSQAADRSFEPPLLELSHSTGFIQNISFPNDSVRVGWREL